MFTRRQFLTMSGVAAAATVLGACAPARTVVQRVRGDGAPLALPPNVADAVWHTLQRTTFGPRADELAYAGEIGRGAWLEEQLAPETIDDGALDWRTRGMETLWMDADLALNVRTEGIQPELQGASVLRAVYSRRQLYETVVEFWSDHFNIAIDKLDCLWLKGTDDREVIRKHAFGNFGELLWASMHSPAMLHYLDNQENYAHSPNENYARELLELHSLGVGAGYTQRDVVETARCLTGWTVNTTWRRGRFEFSAEAHDDGTKTVLGHAIAAEGGEGDGERVFDVIMAHPALPQFIARKLVRRFVADDPPASLVERVAESFRATQGDVKSILRTVLLSDEFLSAESKYKRPHHFVAGAMRQLDAETDAGKPILGALEQMGQPPFMWTMPDGYPDRREAWMNNIFPRWQFALSLAGDALDGTRVKWEELVADADVSMGGALQTMARRLLGMELGREELDAVLTALGDMPESETVQTAAAVVMASPRYQWR